MAIKTMRTGTTIGINAAFLQEIKDSNSRLWVVLHELRKISAVDHTREHSRQFVTQMDELLELVGLEFSLEETYGYISVMGGRFHHAGCSNAQTAMKQHQELFLQLHEICEETEEVQYRGTIGRDLPKLIADFAEFDACFCAHEELEADLIRSGFGLGRSS